MRVTGRLRTFDAPTNLRPRTGLAVEVASSRAIAIERQTRRP